MSIDISNSWTTFSRIWRFLSSILFGKRGARKVEGFDKFEIIGRVQRQRLCFRKRTKCIPIFGKSFSIFASLCQANSTSGFARRLLLPSERILLAEREMGIRRL